MIKPFISPPPLLEVQVMEAGAIYTRVYSSTSERRLFSGRGQLLGLPQQPLDDPSLFENFRNHCDRFSEVPTSLVSVNNHILDAIARAYGLWQDGEDPKNLWVVFIKTPVDMKAATTPCTYHAESLAIRSQNDKPKLFHYEFVVEWAILERFVAHKVSLETLMDRGLDWERYLPLQPPGPWTVDLYPSSSGKYVSCEPRVSLDHLRHFESQDHRNSNSWEIGHSISCIARHFGARAPMGWIAKQLFRDLFRPKKLGWNI
ncbi:hypothetical protein PG993_002249 [Apiospora rasikravindrae]|uniref:DUF7587 domain-containing protein n=1 Tax=Apiospora rasikravindrae TaxID=990691 RepID=A0ABR1TW34_9PEZI